MIEQNADRSIGGIGSIVIGIAILVVAKVAFPQVFDLIINFFKDQINSVTLASMPTLSNIANNIVKFL